MVTLTKSVRSYEKQKVRPGGKSTRNKAVQTKRVGNRCGAYARSTDSPCEAKAMTNGRCKNHGGMSTDPRTLAGRSRIAEATR
jgi:hypothetical protein